MEENNFTPPVGETPGETLLTITRPAGQFLLETSKWAHFLSILGFILTGLIILIALFAGSFMSTIMQGQAETMPRGMGILLSFFYVLMGILYFFPSLYLYRYSQKLKSALSTKNNNELLAAFENEKSLYKFWGIFAIVMMSFYAVILVFAFLASSFMTR